MSDKSENNAERSSGPGSPRSDGERPSTHIKAPEPGDRPEQVPGEKSAARPSVPRPRSSFPSAVERLARELQQRTPGRDSLMDAPRHSGSVPASPPGAAPESRRSALPSQIRSEMLASQLPGSRAQSSCPSAVERLAFELRQRTPGRDSVEIGRRSSVNLPPPRAESRVPPVAKSASPLPRRPDSNQPGSKRTDRPIADPLSLRKTDELKSAENAKIFWEHGVAYLQAQDYENAKERFRMAYELDPHRAAYWMYFLWAVRCAAGESSPDRSHDDELKKLANQHLCLEGYTAFSHYVLGYLALAKDDKRAAEKHFKFAAKHDPANEDADLQYQRLTDRD